MDSLTYQQNQKKVIQAIEDQISQKQLSFSTVTPPNVDFAQDPRLSLTSVHLPSLILQAQVQEQLIKPLQQVSPDHYYFDNQSLHLTIKNVKIIHHPPLFNQNDIDLAKEVFSQVIPQHFAFRAYYYRLLLFPYNLALIGTTDPELDGLVLDLDRKLKKAGIPDDKKYINDRYFFSNVTLARFTQPVTPLFVKMVEELSSSLKFEPYLVDSVTLLTCNAVLKKKNEVATFRLGNN